MGKCFSEIKLFQVKPTKVDEFEELIKRMQDKQRVQKGCINIKYLKRFFIFDTIDNPPREITRIVKCVKYYSYWEFESKEAYHEATQWLFSTYEKEIMKLLIATFDINCGETIDNN